jgi:hypothetical protein
MDNGTVVLTDNVDTEFLDISLESKRAKANLQPGPHSLVPQGDSPPLLPKVSLH